MSLLDKLEHRFHNFGIPGLIRIVALLQAVVYVALLLKPEFREALVLNVDLVKEGQIWRILTFCLIPKTMHIIWIIFTILILIWIGDALESAWGSFRVTLYYFGTVAMLFLGAWFCPIQLLSAELLYLSLFLAFASTFPTAIINLYGILPVQARWLGWLDLAWIGYLFFSFPSVRLGIGLAMVPYLLLALPLLFKNAQQRVRVTKRRAEYASASLPEAEHFHKCSVCGRTDASHPELIFRVLEDDTERCQDHLAG